MPMISSFYGIIIKMYFQQSEHNPPHIHAIYGEYVGVIDIKSMSLIEGDLPDRALLLVKEWLKTNQNALLNMWNTQNFKQLPPLN